MSFGDFYYGLGPQAIWMGSLGAHAGPDRLAALDVGRSLLQADTPQAYQDAVCRIKTHWRRKALGAVYSPDGSWPVATWLDNLPVCRYAFEESVTVAGTGRVWVATVDDEQWELAAPSTPHDRRECPAVRYAAHPDTGTTVPIPRAPAATAAYGYYHALCDRIRGLLPESSTDPRRIPASVTDPEVRDLLTRAANEWVDARRHAERYNIYTAISRARSALDAAERAKRTLESPATS